jgi:hypothetical protein
MSVTPANRCTLVADPSVIMLRGLPYIAAAGKFSALRTWARAKNLAWLHGHRGARLLYAKTAQSPERPGGTREGNAHGHGRDVGRSRFKTRVLVGFDHKSPVLANHVSLAEKELPIARRGQWPPAPRAALNGCLRLVSSPLKRKGAIGACSLSARYSMKP